MDFDLTGEQREIQENTIASSVIGNRGEGYEKSGYRRNWSWEVWSQIGCFVATGSTALGTGWMNVASGLADLVLVVGVEKMTEVPTSAATDIMGRGGDSTWGYPFGTIFSAIMNRQFMGEVSNYFWSNRRISIFTFN